MRRRRDGVWLRFPFGSLKGDEYPSDSSGCLASACDGAFAVLRGCDPCRCRTRGGDLV
jgi:hypothetical protein